MTQVFKCRLAVRAHLVSHLSLRSANGGAQGFDDFAHALELTGMGVVALLLAFLGGGLLEQVATGFLATLNTLEMGVSSNYAIGESLSWTS